MHCSAWLHDCKITPVTIMLVTDSEVCIRYDVDAPYTRAGKLELLSRNLNLPLWLSRESIEQYRDASKKHFAAIDEKYAQAKGKHGQAK